MVITEYDEDFIKFLNSKQKEISQEINKLDQIFKESFHILLDRSVRAQR